MLNLQAKYDTKRFCNDTHPYFIYLICRETSCVLISEIKLKSLKKIIIII